MKFKYVAASILIAFLLSGVFGLYVNFGTMHHMSSCPFAHTSSAVCVGSLEHLKHWKSAFESIVIGLVLFLGAVVISRFPYESSRTTPLRSRYRDVPLRPTLLQELAASGMLNPKIP